jgi:hypothetical protein
VNSKTEKYLLDATQNLYLCGLNRALTPEKARKLVAELGLRLHKTFLGLNGKKYLEQYLQGYICRRVNFCG